MSNRVRAFTFFCLMLFFQNANATVWFGFKSASGSSIVVGLSSGPITYSMGDNVPHIGNISVGNTFVGVGAMAIPVWYTSAILKMSEEAKSSALFLNSLKEAFPDRRFIIGSSDGSILVTTGETGCNSTNVYCGDAVNGNFAIVGGGLVSSEVLAAAMQTYKEGTSLGLPFRDLACKVINSVVSSGGEIKDFQYGVAWIRKESGQSEVIKYDSSEESILVDELVKKVCPR